MNEIHQITTMQWILAYAGSFIYIMMKLQELQDIKGYQLGAYIKKYWASTLATSVMIPVCMLILSENFDDLLPVNNLTAVLVGYQTNQIFKSIMSIGGKKFTKSDENVEQK